MPPSTNGSTRHRRKDPHGPYDNPCDTVHKCAGESALKPCHPADSSCRERATVDWDFPAQLLQHPQLERPVLALHRRLAMKPECVAAGCPQHHVRLLPCGWRVVAAGCPQHHVQLLPWGWRVVAAGCPQHHEQLLPCGWRVVAAGCSQHHVRLLPCWRRVVAA